MMNKALVIVAIGLLFVAGSVVLIRQSAVQTLAADSFPAEMEEHEGPRRASSAPGMPLGGRAVKADSVTKLLEKLERLRNEEENFDRETLAALIGKLLQLDAGVAASFVDAIPAGHARSEALRRFAQAFASRDPERAELWASRLADEAERGLALGEVCSRIALTDAGEAVRKFERHQLDASSGILLENLVQQWADQDYSAAAAWTLARPAGEQRDQMCSRLAIVLSATKPVDAAQLVLREIPDGMIRTETVVSVLYQWGSRDIDGASAWVALFPSGNLKQRAENELSQLRRLR